ncbi:sugar ABC transporter substrate-binding protein [Aeromicrobium sp. CFBP 8757]|uniref:sugar ABC transporter substrate-binding protein n=1 Tax=Aeromicrobium sp. CFBP 8757 TaxID=2775288 RepID=UPI00177BFC64|nr:sugar ABC transporter substrate-binding protein [Aeromicrobium sp. CFBP 8757]MBD8605533.1 sugar ABC transporter substrate-binding protein [Aeromicrobium sp. CFBP 8757]
MKKQIPTRRDRTTESAARRATTGAERGSRRSGGRSRALLGLVIALAVITLSACGGGSSSSAGGGPSGGVDGKSVIMVGCPDLNPWCAVYTKTIKTDLTKAGAKVEHLQDPFDVAQQVQNLQSAIASRPDLILLAPTDDNSLVPSIQQAKAQNIPVIIINSMPAPQAEDNVASTINADQAALGTYAAQNIVEGMKAEGLDGGNIVAITGADATATSGDRMKAFKAELKKNPGFDLVEEKNGNWDPALTGKIASQLFAQYESKGGIQGAYGMADYQANAIIQSAEQAGIPVGVDKKGLIVSGSNCFKVGIDNIKNGLQYGTATQAPDAEGDFVVEYTTKFLEGEDIPKVNLNTENRVTKANLAEFEAGCSIA